MVTTSCWDSKMLLFGCNARAVLMAQGSQGRGQCHPPLGTPALVRLFPPWNLSTFPPLQTAQGKHSGREMPRERQSTAEKCCKPPGAGEDYPSSPGTPCPQPAPKARSQPRWQLCQPKRAGCCTLRGAGELQTRLRTQAQCEDLASRQHPPARPFSNPRALACF